MDPIKIKDKRLYSALFEEVLNRSVFKYLIRVLERIYHPHSVIITGGFIREFYTIDTNRIAFRNTTDLCEYAKKEDIDIVIEGIGNAEVIDRFSTSQKINQDSILVNRFGGIRVKLLGFNLDIWGLQDTIHFMRDNTIPTFNTLTYGDPINLGRVAYHCKEKELNDQGCLDGVRTNVIHYRRGVSYLEPYQATRILKHIIRDRFKPSGASLDILYLCQEMLLKNINELNKGMKPVSAKENKFLWETAERVADSPDSTVIKIMRDHNLDPDKFMPIVRAIRYHEHKSFHIGHNESEQELPLKLKKRKDQP